MMGLVGPDHLDISEDTVSKGIMYLLLAVIIFVGAAFSFALPLVATVVFVLGFAFTQILNFRQDIQTWGIVCLGFAMLHIIGIAMEWKKNSKNEI